MPTPAKKYRGVCGIVESIEINRNINEIQGILLDSEGREFKYKVKTNGDLILLKGVEDDLPLAMAVCIDYLNKKYGKNEVAELKETINYLSENIRNAFVETNKNIEKIEATTIINTVQPEKENKLIETPAEILVEEDDDDEYQEKTFADFSDEDLADHALKVLNGEIPLSN